MRDEWKCLFVLARTNATYLFSRRGQHDPPPRPPAPAPRCRPDALPACLIQRLVSHTKQERQARSGYCVLVVWHPLIYFVVLLLLDSWSCWAAEDNKKNNKNDGPPLLPDKRMYFNYFVWPDDGTIFSSPPTLVILVFLPYYVAY